MRAKDVMTVDVLLVLADADIFEAADLLLSARVSAMPVIDKDGKVVGIISEADLMQRAEIGTTPQKSWLLRALADDVRLAADYVQTHSRRVSDVMTRDVITVGEDATLGEVASLMLKHGIKRLPVVEEGKVVGIVSRADLLQGLMSREPDGGLLRPADAQIRNAVSKAVEKQPWSSKWPTNVVVSAGVVHLWGFAQSDAVRQAYRVAAENVPGVKSVKNHMRAVPGAASIRF
jgi:CBS domain-containing protein